MADDRQGGFAGLSALRISPEDRSAKSSSKMKWLAAAGGVVALLAIALIAFGSRRASVEVATARPVTGAEADTVLNASGYVTPRRRATVAAKITGRVREMLVDEGMTVKSGQVLARLDDSESQAAFASAKADRTVAADSIPELEVNLQDAERTLKRTKDLAQAGYTDQQSLDKAQALVDALKARIRMTRGQVLAAEARMNQAQREIDNCTVRAPFDGVAVSKDAQPGEMVSPISAGGGFTRTGISTIVDMTSLEIEVDVNESYIAKVAQGQKVEATLDAYPDWKIPCAVRTVIPTADRQKATVKVRISFDKLDPRMLPDMGVKVAFLSSEKPAAGAPAKNGALISKDARRELDGKPVAFVYSEGRLALRPIVVAGERNGLLEVSSGIAPGDRVVINGPKNLRDGQKVVVKGD
jgi:RND family efflux transporter MFP subunit